MHLGKLESNPVWADRFEREREILTEASGAGLLGVLHVGSTAIDGVAGQPVLDVIGVYEDADALKRAAAALADRDGYEVGAEKAAHVTVVRWLDRGAVFHKLHTPDDERVHNQLLFRDYLRDHPDAREEYEAVKREAAATHPEDLEGYQTTKRPVVRSVLERARSEGYADRLPDYLEDDPGRPPGP